MVEPTRGQRFYLVRLALGDGVRRPEPLTAFVSRVRRETGIVIHASELSDIENDKPSKAVTADHIAAVAAVDPLQRGKLWLGWNDAPAAPGNAVLAAEVGGVVQRRDSVADAEAHFAALEEDAAEKAKPTARMAVGGRPNKPRKRRP